jgi:hypothetical protein
VIFIGRKLFNIGRESNKTAHGSTIPTDTGKIAPANPQAMFDGLSSFTGKAPPDGKSDKKIMSTPATLCGALKIVRAPGRPALSNSMGNGGGTVWILSIERQPRRLK